MHKYVCPLCSAELRQQVGDQMHPGNAAYGITMDCPSWSCPAQEVMGHGNTAKAAFEVITQRFAKEVKA